MSIVADSGRKALLIDAGYGSLHATVGYVQGESGAPAVATASRRIPLERGAGRRGAYRPELPQVSISFAA